MNAARPLNVLRVITWLPAVGGIERKIQAVLPRLSRDKYRVRLVCLRERGELADALEAEGVPVHLNPMASRLSPSGLRSLARLMREHEIDLVHAHMYRSNVPATIAARMARVPVVVAQIHNVDTWETRRQRAVDRFLCRWRSAVVAVSERVRQDVVANLGLPRERVHVIYNGADISRFGERTPDRERTRAALGLGPWDVAVVYHGRLVAQKRPEALLRIAEFSTPRPRGGGVVVVVAGDGPKRGELEAAARDAGISDRMRFLGRRDDIPEILAACDVAVLPSLKEGFSNSLVEAMASRLPVVATNVGGNAEAVEHGKSGRIVPPGDDHALLGALEDLIEDPALRDRMGAAGAERAQLFSLDRMVANVEALYDELAERAGLR